MNTLDHEQAVFKLVSRKTGLAVSALNLQQRLLQDLGIDGDDAAELFLELSKVHRVDLDRLQFERHFRPEPNLLSVLRLQSAQTRELTEKVPVTIGDLVQAVRLGRWGT